MGGRHVIDGTRTLHELVTLIVRRHDALRTHAGPAHEGTVAGVHQARVASRRLREVVPVLGRGLEDVRLKPLRRSLRDLTRALGPVRELDVALDMIDTLPFDSPDACRLHAAWRLHLERQRPGPVRALRKALAPARRRLLDRSLGMFAAARASSSDDAWRSALARRLAERAGDLRDRIGRTGTLYHPALLHEVRIAVKKLRYVLEITAEAGLARLVVPLRTLKAAQESLGSLHDLDVLLTLLPAVPGAAPGEDLQHAAAAIVATLERESRLRHARYLRTRSALLRVTDTTIAIIMPRVRPATGPAARKAARGH